MHYRKIGSHHFGGVFRYEEISDDMVASEKLISGWLKMIRT